MDRAKMIAWFKNRAENTPMVGARAMYQATYELLTQSQWISVKERLPKDEWEKICKEQNAEIYPCLCYRRSSSHYDKWYVTKAYFDGEYFVDLDNIIIDEYITHWMPLPEPPDGGADHE